MPLSKRVERGIGIGDKIAKAAEGVIAMLLLFMLFAGIASLALDIFTSFSPEVYTVENLKKLIDRALVLFIILELYVITISYIRGEPVVKEVFIATFIAVGRKVLTYDYTKWGLSGAIALSILILSISISYFLLYRISYPRRRSDEKQQ